MNSKKLMFLLLLILLILAGVLFYLFSNSELKTVSFSEDNLSTVQEVEQKNDKEKDKENKKQEIKVISSKKQDEKKERIQNEPRKEPKQVNFLTNSDLAKEYKDFLSKSKRDTSLGEPRYNVYILDSAKLTKAQRRLVNDITTTFSIRGGYFVYEIFVQKLSNENLKIYVFNKDLLNNDKWVKLPANALPNMLFKFNQHTVLSIKNSFHIKNLKRELGKSAKIHSIQIDGYTDELGTNAYNYELGLKRTAAVASEFLRQSAKISLQSFGKEALFSTKSYENRCAVVVFN